VSRTVTTGMQGSVRVTDGIHNRAHPAGQLRARGRWKEQCPPRSTGYMHGSCLPPAGSAAIARLHLHIPIMIGPDPGRARTCMKLR
jgi:hypothetical protein